MGSNLCNLTSNLLPRFRRLGRGPRFGMSIHGLGRGRCSRLRLRCLRHGFTAEGLVPIPYDAQPLQGQKLVHFFDEVGRAAKQRPQSARRNHARFFTQLIHQPLQNAVDQTEIPVVESGLQTTPRSRSNHPTRLANLPSRAAPPPSPPGTAPLSAEWFYRPGLPVPPPGSTNSGLRWKYRPHPCRNTESSGGTTDEITIP